MQIFEKLVALLVLIILMPLWLLLYVLIKFDSQGPFFFRQRRLGKNGKEFDIYKIRTMKEDADKLQKKYEKVNEANGPVFKIRNDPRYTKIGKIIAHLGFDELPQLINIIKGEMSFIGPRPLPIAEAQAIPQKYKKREVILPGITSIWAIRGGHALTFKEWMESDLEYMQKKSIFLNIYIIFHTLFVLFKAGVIKLTGLFRNEVSKKE
ncbi:MAG: Exopolysaccharide biosynthesis polyprenyl glycosylphosphotransferase [Candidatus Daviesbacteria bacterium GW2011_GWA1_36_8]|nr:MAG: Exopolysaccharide biosynthesis polyprenyl glycosylphosphotransferase [Candidatus Daviesbacteria bacterium GW2011_GWA1_36_8]